MQKIKKHLPLVVIVIILFATGVVFYNVFTEKTQAVLGEDSEDSHSSSYGSHDEEDSHDSSSYSHDNEDSHDSSSYNHDNSDEEDGYHSNTSSNQDDEHSTRTVRTGSQQNYQGEDQEENDNEEGDEVENDNEDGDNNDAQEEIQDLNKSISRVESKINVLSTNGVNVSSLTAALSEIKDLASQAEAKMTTAPSEAETLIETADHKLERLKKLIEMTLGDEDDDENDDDSDALEEIQDLAKDIAEVETKLNAISAKGIDVSTLKTSLSGIKDILNQAKEKAAAGDLSGAEALKEVADKKLETLKHSMELTYGDDDEKDGDEAKEYKNEVAQFVHNLKDLGDIEGGIGQQVRVVAQAQNDAEPKVEESMNEVRDRGGFVRFLIGPKYGSIAEIKTAITENQTRIKVLTDLMNQMTDPAVKLVLQDQITMLNQQNANLQKFVADSESGFSLFGWFTKMFS